MLSFKALARLFILILNKVTERMLPWGTPISCSCMSEYAELILTLKVRQSTVVSDKEIVLPEHLQDMYNRGDTTSEAPRLVAGDPPEKTCFLDNVTVTVEQDSLQRYAKDTRLTRDLRLREPHSARPGQSGDRDPSNRIVTITLLYSNLLPRGLKSYDRLPSDLLP